MALLPAIEAGSERTILEMTLATLQGTAAVQVLGPGSIEAARAYQRAQSLLDDAPLHPLRGLFLHGLGLILWMRGELWTRQTLWPSVATRFPLPLRIRQRCFARAWYTEWSNTRAAGRLARQWLEKCIDEAKSLDEYITCAVRCRSDRSCPRPARS